MQLLNFAFALEHDYTVYLIDYGSVMQILPGHSISGTIGTPLFASRDALAKAPQCKRSDLGKFFRSDINSNRLFVFFQKVSFIPSLLLSEEDVFSKTPMIKKNYWH